MFGELFLIGAGLAIVAIAGYCCLFNTQLRRIADSLEKLANCVTTRGNIAANIHNDDEP